MLHTKISPNFRLCQKLERENAGTNRMNDNCASSSARIPRSGLIVLLVAVIAALAVPVSAYTTDVSIRDAGKVYVSGVTLDPGTLFSGDTCTATYSVTDGNANQSVYVNHASVGGSNDVRLISGSYDTNANIGPLQTRTFVFLITTEARDGSYFPTFSMDFRDADSLYYRTQVKVDNTPLLISVLDQPDTFTQDKKDVLNLQIANPRQNAVKNVVLEVSGDGITATPSQKYIGTLGAGNASNVSVSVTPGKETTLSLIVKYDNGDNHHSVTKTIPVTFGTDKKKAAPQMSNIKVKLESGIYHVTGDVTNAGLTTANGVTVTSLSPATPKDPYQSYVIGALKADDFGSFEVTFAADGLSSVPLQVSYKDTDGNILTSRQDISLAGTTSQETASQPSLLPVIAIILVVALAAGGYLYLKRKQNQ